MSFFGRIFETLEHDSKPLLSAAAHWAESEGIVIVQLVEAEVKSLATPELVALFNSFVGKEIGILLPAGASLGFEAIDLLITAIARSRAQQKSGTTLRTSILNAGIEQAVLLLKGQTGDTSVAPAAAAAPMEAQPAVPAK